MVRGDRQKASIVVQPRDLSYRALVVVYELVLFRANSSEEAEHHNFVLIICTCVQIAAMVERDVRAAFDWALIKGGYSVWMDVVMLYLVNEGDH